LEIQWMELVHRLKNVINVPFQTLNVKLIVILFLNLKLIHWTTLTIKGRECYLNTYISIFFQEINKCPFEHCSECPVDQYGCKTICE
jgi:hypothetical protein